MNNLNEIEALWQHSVPANLGPATAEQFQSIRRCDVNRRGRILRWEFACLLFALVATPAFFIINHVHGDRPETVFGVLYLIIFEGAYAFLLAGVMRRMSEHRQLLARRAASVKDHVQTTLTVISAEMRDYRLGAIVMPASLTLTALSLIGKYVEGAFPAEGLAGRLAAIVAFGVLLGLIGWRHYRFVLEPQRQSLTEISTDLEST